MPRLTEQLAKGQKKYQEGLNRFMSRVPLRQATATGVATHFNQVFRRCDFGEPPLMTKKTMGMLGTFIRMALRENRESEWIYNLVSLMVESWDELRDCEFVTQKGKPWVIGPRPSLMDLVTCSGTMISHIEDIKRIRYPDESKEVDVPVEETPSVQRVAVPEKRIGFEPSQDEIDEDFGRMQENE